MTEATMSAVATAPSPGDEPEKETSASKVRKPNARIQQDAPIESMPLSQIDNTVYPNYRRLSSNKDIEGLMVSLANNGQRQNLVAGKQPSGKAGLACGFQRYEARERLAVKHVVDEFNKHFDYKPIQDEYVHLSGETKALNPRGANDWRASTVVMAKNRRRLRDVSPDWAKKYDDALAACLVNVQVKVYANAAEAALDNALENEVRNDPSLADKTEMIIGLIAGGMKAGEVARTINESPATISHYQRIARIIPFLEEQKKEAATSTGLTGDNLAAFLRKMDAGICELDRRWKLPDDDSQYIQFQKLRFLSETVDPAKDDKKLPLLVIVDLVGLLVRLNTKGDPTDEPTYDMGTLRQRFKDVIELDRQEKEVAAQAAADAVAKAAGLPTASETSDAVKAAASAGAAKAAATPASATVADAAKVQGAQQAAANVKVTGTATVQNTTAPTDAARQASIDAANAALEVGDGTHLDDNAPTSNLDDADEFTLPPTADELAGTIGEVPSKPEDGAMKSKTSEATKSRYTAMAPEKVEVYAMSLIKDLADPAQAELVSPYDIISWFGGAKQLFYVMGLHAQADAVNEVMIEYIEGQAAYLAKLEELLEKQKVDVQTSIKSLKPTPKTIVLPE